LLIFPHLQSKQKKHYWQHKNKTRFRRWKLSDNSLTLVTSRLTSSKFDHPSSSRKEPMETRRLGNSDLMITPVGIGAWAIGGDGWAFSWSKQDDSESIRAIHTALDSGVNWIDTAAVYGLGHSESVVAEALKLYSGSKPYVFTKCERNWDENRQIVKSLKADSIRKECEDSLRRLQVETIDLYQVHWPEPDEDIEEGWSTLAKLQQEGKVRWIGVSNFNVDQMQRISSIAPITSLQPPYSLIRRDVESEILPHAHAQNIGVIAYSPMGSGLLTGTMSRQRLASLPPDDWRTRSIHFNEPLLTRNLEIAERVSQTANKLGFAPGHLAIAWVLSNPAVTGAIVGIRNTQQAQELAKAIEIRPEDYASELASLGAA
jgi:aryl-alcohol dehydrogenase-like predicted oxidoreductase